MTAIFENGNVLDTTVEFTIAAGPDGNRCRLQQCGFPRERDRDDFAGGWRDVLGEVDRRAHA